MRAGGAYWVTSVGFREPRLIAQGSLPREPGEESDSLLARLRAQGVGGRAGVEVALRSPDLEHLRIELPPLSYRQAGAVGLRRAAELAASLPMETTFGFARGSGNKGRSLWMCASPLALAQDFDDRWRLSGFDVARLASHHLALGNIARLLPPNQPGCVTALVDFDEHDGTCVITDDVGWVFSRQIPLKFAGEKRLQGEVLDDGDEIQLAEESYSQAERITTELERTIRYVQSVLSLGSVGRVIVSGEDDGLEDLAVVLAVNLDLPVTLLGAAIPPDSDAFGIAPGAAVALGLAMGQDREGANLMPAHRRLQRRSQELRQTLKKAIAATLVATLILAAQLVYSLDSLDRHYGDLRQTWSASAAQRAEARAASTARESAAALATVLGEIDRPTPSGSHILDALAHLTPDDAAIERLVIEPGAAGGWSGTLVVDARGETVSAAAVSVSSLARVLDESPLLSVDRVERLALPRSTQLRADAEKVRFQVDARIAPVSYADPIAFESLTSNEDRRG